MIDSHCHLADDAFAADLPDVVGRAQAAGLTSALCILGAEDAAEAERAGRVRRVWDRVRFAAGVHPHQAGAFDGRAREAAETTGRALEAFGACAVGEIGLDYHYDFSPSPVQRDVFAAQVSLAVDRRLPIVIHTREAADDTLAVLSETGAGVRGVFHCFTGDAGLARRALDLGFYLSFAGIVTFRRATELREAARLVPDDRLLIETDSPYLAPVPHRGQRNEPAFVARVLATLAEIRGVPAGALARTVDDNFEALFGPTSVQ